MLKYSLFVVLSVFLSFNSFALENPVAEKVLGAKAVTIERGQGKFTPLPVKPKNRAGQLCSPNNTLSCTTVTVEVDGQQCKKDVCTCANLDGSGTFESHGTRYACVPLTNLPDPAETQGNLGN
jgi:hypothetical protein